MDLDGVDAQGTLTVVELKIKEDPGQLIQALGYFDYLLERGMSFFKNYSQEKIEDKMPRMILIAPSFDERTKIAVKYISEDIQVTLKQICFSYELNGKKYVKLIDVETRRRTEIERPLTQLHDLANYITNDDVRKVWDETVKIIEELDQGNIRHTLVPYRINFIHKSKGLKFAELYPRRNYFLIDWKADPEWGK